MCWGACTPRVRAPSWCMLLAGVLLLWDCQIECQLLTSTSVVHDSAELASVLRDAGNASQTTPTDTVIYLKLLSSEAARDADFFVINRQDFLNNATIDIWPGQKVTIASVPNGPKTLDFAGVSTILNIMGNGTLEIIGINVRGIASRHLLGAKIVPNLRAVSFAFWPTITAQPGAKAAWVNMSTFFLSDDCSSWAQRGPQSGIGVFLAAGATLQNSVTLNMDQGGATVALPLVDRQDVPQGTMQLAYTDSRAICVQDPSTLDRAPASGGPFQSSFHSAPPAPTPQPAAGAARWWIALVAAVGAALLAACVGAGAFLLWRRRHWGIQRGNSRGPQGAGAQATPKLDSPVQGLSLKVLGSVEGKAESDVGTPVLTEQWRKRWMGARGDEQIEIGPMIGRGGYGKVFKARWKSTMVAVKVVEHSHIPKSNSKSKGSGVDRSDPASAEARIAREMLLSTSISHPNVIATYKICTSCVGSMLDSGFPDTSEQSRESRKQRGAEPAKAAGKLQSVRSEEINPGRASLSSPRSELQDIAEERQQFSSAESAAASHASSSRETGQLLETWIVMEYADRENLADALRSRRFPSHNFVAVYRCLLDIAAGVDYLHDADMIHGDLKSANVLLKSTGTDARGFTCKLADFGLTRVLDVEKNTHVSTQTYGTVAYMPPELLSSSRLTRAADIYSFGMLMWEITTSTMPWERMTVGQVFFAVVQEDSRPLVPEELPQAYRDLMTECWTREAKDRPLIHAVLKRLQGLYKEYRSQGFRQASSAPPPQ